MVNKDKRFSNPWEMLRKIRAIKFEERKLMELQTDENGQKSNRVAPDIQKGISTALLS